MVQGPHCVLSKLSSNVQFQCFDDLSKWRCSSFNCFFNCSFKLHDQAASVQAIESCLNDIDAWMLANMLKLNRDKTELLVIGPKHKVNPPIKGIHVAGEYIEVSNNARNIGVIFYAHVNLEKHVMNTCKTAFYHLRNIAKIRNCLSQDNAERLVHAFISSKLDFCNALLYGLPQSVIDRLQYVQNCAARLVTRTRSSEHITPVLRSLHWLPVRQRITYTRTKYYFLRTKH